VIRSIIIGAAALAAIAGCLAPPAHAAEPYTCTVFEDDSFACGTILQTDAGWSIDTSKPWVSGCIPGGLCDNPLNPQPPRRHAPVRH